MEQAERRESRAQAGHGRRRPGLGATTQSGGEPHTGRFSVDRLLPYNRRERAIARDPVRLAFALLGPRC